MTENPLARFVRHHLDVELPPWQQEILARLWQARGQTPTGDVGRPCHN